jgi:FkbM family methyltransferase
MFTAAKRLIVGSPWESPVKHAHYLLTRAKNSLYDVQTIEIFRRALRPDSTGIDVGCFEGSMLRHMIRFAPRGKHIAFEPNPEKAAALSRRFPGHQIHAVALGEAPGRQTFHEAVDTPALSGLRRRADVPAGSLVHEHKVHVETLDRLVPPGAPVALIKVDVEGGELGVFRGAVQTLRSTRPVVVFECGLGGADLFGSAPGDIFDALHDGAALRLFLMGEWLDNGAPLTREQFVEQFTQGLNYYFVAAP